MSSKSKKNTHFAAVIITTMIQGELHACLIKHTYPDTQTWDKFPGGMAKEEKTWRDVKETAIQKCQDETGIIFRPDDLTKVHGAIVQSRGKKGLILKVWYMAELPEGQQILTDVKDVIQDDDNEIQHPPEWVVWEQIEPRVIPSHRKAYYKACELLG